MAQSMPALRRIHRRKPEPRFAIDALQVLEQKADPLHV
jgi:hypothetical protein